MYQPNFERIAQKIVRESLGVQPGQQVLVDARSDALPFAELLAIETFRAGGAATIVVRSDEVKFREILESPIEQLSLPLAPTVAAIGAADFNVTVGLYDAEPARFAGLPPERERAHNERRRARANALYNKPNRRWVGTDYPTRYMAEAFGVPWNRFFEMYWRAMDVDYGALREQVATMADHFERAEQIHIRTPSGTDVRMRRGGRPLFLDDGVIRDIGNLPAGELYFAPIESSVEGRIVFDRAFYQGQRIEGLEFQFEGGLGTPIGAKLGYELFSQRWEVAVGDKERLGEMGIGLNPEVFAPIGYELTDHKVLGAVHLSLGRNDLTGGINQGTLRWAMLLLQATVTLDDDVLLDRGRFVFR